MIVLLTTKIYAIAADVAPSSSTEQIASAGGQSAATAVPPPPLATEKKSAAASANLCAQGGCEGKTSPATMVGAGQNVAPQQTANPQSSALMQDLAARKADLDRQTEALGERQRLIDAAEAELQRRMAALSEKEDHLADGQRHAAILSHEDTDRLVRIYEAMRPADAAAIFNVLDLRVGVPLLKKMSPRKASAIMALMSPQRAILATQLLASETGRPVLQESH